jgi:hypothetical protein
LRKLSELEAEVFVPGHGPPGDTTLVSDQLGYHETLAELIGRGPREAAAQAIATRFPDYLLSAVLSDTVTTLSRRVASTR